MNVSFTPELERRIAEKVESGLYTSAGEVVRESLRLLFAAEEHTQRQRLRADIRLGLDQLDRGESIQGEQLHAEFSERVGRRRRS